MPPKDAAKTHRNHRNLRHTRRRNRYRNCLHKSSLRRNCRS
jgi:hypothetical protein